ncbi:hypothetical protein PENSPDRAFT_650785 [Peniophora sp. CONT]|nr:hypothetical protein PENSPDRAFT_650785 [Peniophora sp. CONT]
MNEEKETATSSPLGRWEELFREQSEIFHSAVTRAEALEAEVKELRRENAVWKNAHKKSEDDHEVTKRIVLRLERNMDAIKDNNPLLVCLIDGDGTIFAPDLLAAGRTGGRQAASLLNKGLVDYIADLDDTLPPRCQVWLSIYCNKKGLVDTLVNNNVCSYEQFEEFYHGFNQASPMFSIIDVGYGKEAADAKIKENLRVFTKFPQTYRIFLGGSHDNGYSTTINHLANEGYLDKLILLKGYKMLAQELKSFDLPQVQIEGLFMTTKMAGAGHNRNLSSSPTKQLRDGPLKRFFPDSQQRLPVGQSQSTPQLLLSQNQLGLRQFDPAIPLKNYKPPPCTWYYLTKCKNNSRCRFAHDFQATPKMIEQLKIAAKRSPCAAVAKNKHCPQGDACFLGHVCPRGPSCSFLKSKKCKFTGKDSHKLPFGAAANAAYLGAMRIVDDTGSDDVLSSVGSPGPSDSQLSSD